MRDDIQRRESGRGDPIQVDHGATGRAHFRTVQFAVRRPGFGGLLLLLAGLGALVAIGLLLTLGALLLVALAAGGAALGGAMLLYRRLRRALRGDAEPAGLGRPIGALDPVNELPPTMEIRTLAERPRE